MDEHLNDQPSFTKKVWQVGGIILLILILAILITKLFNVLLLVLAGILMAIYFHGCANLLHRYIKIPEKFSVLVSVLLNLILVIGFFWLIGARLQQQITELSDTLPQTLSNFKDWLQQYPIGNKILDKIDGSAHSQKALGTAKTFFSSTFGILSDIYIIILLGLFFTAKPEIYKKGFLHLMPPKAKNKALEILEEIHNGLKNWIKGQLFGFVFIAVLTGLGLWIIGVPLILTLALLAGLSNFIPNFGPVIALVPAFLLALMQDSTTALLVVSLYAFIQIVQSAVTQPLIQQKMVNLPPAVIIFGQVAMGMLCGFWGVLLATPFLVIIMIVVNQLYVDKQHSE